jgi:hypothetical protein
MEIKPEQSIQISGLESYSLMHKPHTAQSVEWADRHSLFNDIDATIAALENIHWDAIPGPLVNYYQDLTSTGLPILRQMQQDAKDYRT